MSLRLKLLLALVPLFVIGLAAADIGTYASLHSFLLSRVDQQLTTAHVDMFQGGDGGRDGSRPGGEPPPDFSSGTFIEVLSPGGDVVSQQCASRYSCDTTTHPVLPAGVTGGPEGQPNLLTVDGAGSVSRYRVGVTTATNGSGDLVVVAIPLDDVSSTLNRLLGIELGISGGVTLLLLLATWLIVRRSLRPLVRMGDTARSIAAHDLSPRVEPANDRTEVGRLGLALNTMLDDLESAFAARAASEERLRHFVSDASHELRTPLTSMRGYAELFRRNPAMQRDEIAVAMRRIEDEAQRMGVLVDDLLLLARLDQGRALERRAVDLDALIADACADARASDPGRRITARVAAPLMVIGDDMRLRQVLGNLLTNARVHTPAGTPVEVELERRGDVAVLDVIDHGPGIPAGAAERIFERFVRADPGRSRDRGGSGLGLSIVAAVVAAHGGSIRVLETAGGGATFRIELPLSGRDTRTAPAETRTDTAA